MNRITSFQIPSAGNPLRTPAFGGDPSAPLAEPMQALVTAASRRAAQTSFTVYLCADDDTTRTRDEFAITLARSLTPTIPSTLIIDCDFLHPGLNGQVPQRDALGFLDYLLYGSSIGVIQQEADGVHIVGTGSFPVTKRMPFVDTAFTDAARRLVAHARCVIFVGPAFDGDGGRHPLMGLVDVVATLRSSPRHPRLDAAEEHVGTTGIEVWSIRLGEAPVAQTAPAASAPPPPRRPAEPVVPPAPAAPAREPAPAAEMPARDLAGGASSLVSRIVVIAIGLLVILFVGWWFLQNRGAVPLTETADTNEAALTRVDTARTAPDTTARQPQAAGTPPPATAGTDTTARTVAPKPVPAPPASTTPAGKKPGGATGGTQLVSSEDIQLMEDLDRQFHGWFVIHISSFQTSARAREEVAFLESREFPAFIVFLDLGPKGKWYRVYAGPFQTREEAQSVKKNLDAIPQVRFTRIASIPD